MLKASIKVFKSNLYNQNIMNQQMKIRTRSFLSILMVACCIAAISSCKVNLLPSYNAAISEQIDNTAKTIDKFYLSMLETTNTENDGRSFKNFTDKYVEIEVELNSLLNKNKIRPLNKNSTRICEITLQFWVKYKEEHKVKNTLKDGLILLNRKTFNDLFYAMRVADEGIKLGNSLPQ